MARPRPAAKRSPRPTTPPGTVERGRPSAPRRTRRPLSPILFPRPVPPTSSRCWAAPATAFCYATSAPILAPTFTVEAYFRLTSTDPGTGDVKPILRVGTPGSGVLSLELLNLDGNGGTDDLLLVMSNDALELHRFDVLPNTNHHVAATFDGAKASLYLDGALVDSANFSGFSGSGTMAAAIGNSTLGNEAFQGNIDELRISDVALTPSQFLVPEPSWLGLGGLALLPRLCRRRERRRSQ